MVITQLPVGVYPDVTYAGGKLQIAYSANGRLIYDAGTPVDVGACIDGWPRFSQSGQLGYVDDTSFARVWNTALSEWANNQVPIIWGDVSCPNMFAVKTGGNPGTVLAFDITDLTKQPVNVGSAFAAASLLRLQLIGNQYVLTSSSDTALDIPDWLGDGSGDVVSQYDGVGGGILATLSGIVGLLASGVTGSPKLAKAPDGTYAVIYWSWDSHGALPMTLLTGVTPADLQPIAAIPVIAPYTTPKVIAPYPARNGALTTHTAGMNSRLIFGTGLVDLNGKVIATFTDTEHGDPVSGGQIVYADLANIPTVAPALDWTWQVMAFNGYPNPGETPTAFMARVQTGINACRGYYLLVANTCNRGTLTDAETMNGMALIRGLSGGAMCLGNAFFGLDATGQFKPIYQQCVDQFSSPGLPVFPTKPVPPPVHDSSTLLLLRRG